jgi:hypothetical protein
MREAGLIKAWGFGDNTIEPILRARGGRSRHLSLGPRGWGFESLRLRALQAQGIEILIATTNKWNEKNSTIRRACDAELA